MVSKHTRKIKWWKGSTLLCTILWPNPFDSDPQWIFHYKLLKTPVEKPLDAYFGIKYLAIDDSNTNSHPHYLVNIEFY